MISKDDYTEFLEKRNLEAKSNKERDLKSIAVEAVMMEKLTGDPNWDRFLSYLQPIIEGARSSILSARMQLESPDIFDPIELSKIKTDLIKLKERLETLESISNIPKEIIEKGHLAQESLKKIS